MTGGNPQTLLWKPPSIPPADSVRMMQAMWALDNLAGCDFLWFIKNMDLYSPVSEEEGLARVIEDLVLPPPAS
jgi:hypothetical protein